ncbi:hypothetical protein LZ30DRAFT_10714 [Colletotrichum cereale]|nr:hypothetical protein LZ30DRAFT_10714 [Colletotrichum cereale]
MARNPHRADGRVTMEKTTRVPVGEARSGSKEGQPFLVRFHEPILMKTLPILRPQGPSPLLPPSKKLGGTLHELGWLRDGSWRRLALARSGRRQTCHPVGKASPSSRVVPAWEPDPCCVPACHGDIYNLACENNVTGAQKQRPAPSHLPPLLSLLATSDVQRGPITELRGWLFTQESQPRTLMDGNSSPSRFVNWQCLKTWNSHVLFILGIFHYALEFTIFRTPKSVA